VDRSEAWVIRPGQAAPWARWGRRFARPILATNAARERQMLRFTGRWALMAALGALIAFLPGISFG
jgi:hypothetical protein